MNIINQLHSGLRDQTLFSGDAAMKELVQVRSRSNCWTKMESAVTQIAMGEDGEVGFLLYLDVLDVLLYHNIFLIFSQRIRLNTSFPFRGSRSAIFDKRAYSRSNRSFSGVLRPILYFPFYFLVLLLSPRTCVSWIVYQV